MSEIKRFDIPRNGNEFMHEDPDGEYVLYDDHLAEMLRMRAEVRRLTGDLSYTIDRCRALELAVEQADEMKAHAEASVAAEEAETDRVTAERDAAQVEVERLRTTLAWADATIYRLQAERDQTATNPKGREVGAGSPSDQSAQNLDMVANCKETLTSLRPTDEDIWLKLWLHFMPDFGERDAAEMAEGVLAEYRKRWPR